MTVAQADLALRLVAARGRKVNFIKLDKTSAVPAKPWRGNPTPRVAPAAEAEVDAVFVSPGGAPALGLGNVADELVKRSTQIAIVAPGSTSTDKLENFDEIVDFDGTRWRVIFTDILQPADIRIVYFVGVAQ